jgi:lipopolysaccharide assembly outer membrane protein LptD (OstA)
MKLLPLSALLIASAVAQDRPIVKPNPKTSFQYEAGAAATISTMPATAIDFASDTTQRDGSVLRLKGNVEIKYGDQTLKADEADYHWDTGTIEARGNVRITRHISYRPR